VKYPQKRLRQRHFSSSAGAPSPSLSVNATVERLPRTPQSGRKCSRKVIVCSVIVPSNEPTKHRRLRAPCLTTTVGERTKSSPITLSAVRRWPDQKPQAQIARAFMPEVVDGLSDYQWTKHCGCASPKETGSGHSFSSIFASAAFPKHPNAKTHYR
jgi:hypothetical protein